jgi:hypothetical protein
VCRACGEPDFAVVDLAKSDAASGDDDYWVGSVRALGAGHVPIAAAAARSVWSNALARRARCLILGQTFMGRGRLSSNQPVRWEAGRSSRSVPEPKLEGCQRDHPMVANRARRIDSADGHGCRAWFKVGRAHSNQHVSEPARAPRRHWRFECKTCWSTRSSLPFRGDPGRRVAGSRSDERPPEESGEDAPARSRLKPPIGLQRTQAVQRGGLDAPLERDSAAQCVSATRAALFSSGALPPRPC